ncbi:unnamed protein product [Prunus brigantina]
MTPIHETETAAFCQASCLPEKHKENTKAGSSRSLDHGIMGRGRGSHAPFNEVVPLTIAANPLGIRVVRRKHSHEAQSPRSGRWPRFMGVTPPCFTIPNADLTTHLPQSDSTMQIFSGPQANLFQPRLAL